MFVLPFLGAARRHPSQLDRGAPAAESDPQEAQRVHPGGGGGVPQAVDAVCKRSQTHPWFAANICKLSFVGGFPTTGEHLQLVASCIDDDAPEEGDVAPAGLSQLVCGRQSCSVISRWELFGSQQLWVTLWFQGWCVFPRATADWKHLHQKSERLVSGSAGFGLLPLCAAAPQTLAHSCACRRRLWRTEQKGSCRATPGFFMGTTVLSTDPQTWALFQMEVVFWFHVNFAGPL